MPQAQILQFPKQPKRKSREAYLRAFKELLEGCPCAECRSFVNLLNTNPAKAEQLLMGETL